MVINSPFLHYLTVPASLRNHDGNVAGAKCVMGAIGTVELLQTFKDEDKLNEAHSFILRSLAFAAMTLLFVEFSGLDMPGIEVVKIASSIAESLLEGMALQHPAALTCYKSLQVCILNMQAVGSHNLLTTLLQRLYRVRRRFVQSLPELTPSGTTSSWTSPSADGFEPSGSSATVNFPGNTLHLQQMHD